MSGKKQKQLIELLASDKTETVLKTLDEVRNRGGILVFPKLFELLRLNKDKDVSDAVVGLLNDTKYKEAPPHFVDAICDKQNKEQLAVIVSACWQSGLDFSDYIEVFIGLMDSPDVNVAIEASSVIESHKDSFEESRKKKFITLLKNKIPKVPDVKKELIVELIHLIEQIYI